MDDGNDYRHFPDDIIYNYLFIFLLFLSFFFLIKFLFDIVELKMYTNNTEEEKNKKENQKIVVKVIEAAIYKTF